MNTQPAFSNLNDFLSAPIEAVRPFVPATVIFSVGGTRRAAVLSGLSPDNDEFVRHSRRQMLESFEMLFTHGVHHLLSPAIIPEQWQEVTPGYRQSLATWVDWGISGKDALEYYQRLGWRARLIGTESIPELAATAQRLQQETNPDPGAPTLWYTVAATEGSFWEHFLEIVPKSGAKTQAEAIRALYGEDIPPSELFLGHGKPLLYAPTVPPLLIGHLQCYWRQKLGYHLSQEDLRTIIYDCTFTRKTWRKDKTGRAEAARAYVEIWKQAPIVGLGTRLGPFWYPGPIAPLPPETQAEQK